MTTEQQDKHERYFQLLLDDFARVFGYNAAHESADFNKIKFLVSSNTYKQAFLRDMWNLYLSDPDDPEPCCMKVFLYQKNLAKYSYRAYSANSESDPISQKNDYGNWGLYSCEKCHGNPQAIEFPDGMKPKFLAKPCACCGGRVKLDMEDPK